MSKEIIVGYVPCPECDAPAGLNTSIGLCRVCGYATKPLFDVNKAILEKDKDHYSYYYGSNYATVLKERLGKPKLYSPNHDKEKE